MIYILRPVINQISQDKKVSQFSSRRNIRRECVHFSATCRTSKTFHWRKVFLNYYIYAIDIDILVLYNLTQRYRETLFYIYCSVHHNILWNNQQMQLYAVNFIPLLSSLYSQCLASLGTSSHDNLRQLWVTW